MSFSGVSLGMFGPDAFWHIFRKYEKCRISYRIASNFSSLCGQFTTFSFLCGHKNFVWAKIAFTRVQVHSRFSRKKPQFDVCCVGLPQQNRCKVEHGNRNYFLLWKLWEKMLFSWFWGQFSILLILELFTVHNNTWGKAADKWRFKFVARSTSRDNGVKCFQYV